MLIMSGQQITLGTMIDFDSNLDLHLPSKWIQTLKDKNQTYAIFIVSSDNTIRLIPTHSPSAIKFHLDLESIEDNLLEKLLGLFAELKISPLYNSGVCFVGEECFLEFFFERNEDSKPILKLVRQKLENFHGIKEIKTEIYEF